jgi:chromosome segregation protein
LRDCTGRGGTRLNGQSVTDAVLSDGDILQVGTFSFEVRLPAGQAAPVTDACQRRLERSRRNLAYLALGLRKKLRLGRDALRSQEEIDQQADRLRALQRELDGRRKQQEQAEAAVRQEQAAREHALATRAQELEAAEAGLRSEAPLAEVAKQVPLEAQAERAAELDRREQKLARLADKLRKVRQQLHEEAQEFAREKEAAGATAPVGDSSEVVALRQEVEHLREQLGEEKVRGAERAVELDRREQKLAQLADKLRKVRQQLEGKAKEFAREKAAAQAAAPVGDSPELVALRQEVEHLREQLGQEKGRSAERTADLDRREQKLAQFADKLRKVRQQLHEKAQEFAREKAAARAAAPVGDSPELVALRQEVEHLREQLGEEKVRSTAQQAELQALRAMEETQSAMVEISGGAEMHALIDRLRKEVRERDALLANLTRRLEQHSSRPDGDAESYEAELNRYRLELEQERRSLNEQLAQLQQRHAEVEEAARETELQMARERATFAREQAELNRLRQELSRVTNRSGREQEVRDRVAGVMRLKDEILVHQEGEPPEAAGPRRRSLFGKTTAT